ncbi:unnamed protein product [Ranitomeya imitator]|uniref:Uncharacterized protein n=1 Tax=Ranitomeya imitator TaxID=111125 RepID=A0ABN9MH87_9NEOB|nr:unnamed protein product [Ranitomeya imitator]
MCNWKNSSRYPQCQSHLINMEMGIEQWFWKIIPAQVRSKRGVLEEKVGSLINTMDIHTLKSDLENIGYIGGKGVENQKSLNQVLENIVWNAVAVLGSCVSHLQDTTLALIESEQESPVAKHWLGCEQNICVGTSLIPVSGREETLVPITVLGIPVSHTQLLFYQLCRDHTQRDTAESRRFKQSSGTGTLERSMQPHSNTWSCRAYSTQILHLTVMCLPGQDKVIYHSCFHNHASCHAKVENVHTIHVLVTSVSANKICFQVMSEKEVVSAFFSSCLHAENLTIGLYCTIEGNVKTLSKKEGSINITSLHCPRSVLSQNPNLMRLWCPVPNAIAPYTEEGAHDIEEEMIDDPVVDPDWQPLGKRLPLPVAQKRRRMIRSSHLHRKSCHLAGPYQAINGLNTHIARLISLEMMPYRLVESEAFKALMAYAVPRYELPSQHFFARKPSQPSTSMSKTALSMH